MKPAFITLRKWTRVATNPSEHSGSSGMTGLSQKFHIIRRALAIFLILMVFYSLTYEPLPTTETEIVEAIRAIVIACGLSWWLWWDTSK